MSRQPYIDLISALLQPHVEARTIEAQIIEPAEDKAQALEKEIHGILDSAVIFGMKAIGYAERGEVAIQWGPRYKGRPTGGPSTLALDVLS